MLSRLRSSGGRLLAAAGLALLVGAGPARAELDRLEIMAPSGPGGGYDLTARGLQTALQEAGLAKGVQVTNVTGGGGTVGLAQFITGKKGRGNALLVVGLVLEGGILINKSPVSFADVTPLARLVGEYDILVVPAESEIKTLDDLMKKLKANPTSVSWAGGGAGGADHILAGLIAKAGGVDPAKVNYIAHDGGGQALATILGGHVTLGVNGLQEMMPQVRSGKLRALAVSSPERLPGIDVPTLKEQGVDVSLVNWRGLMAPPGLRDHDRQALSDAVAKVVQSPAWKNMLATRGWIDLYQPADQFAAFLKEDQARTTAVLKELGLFK